MMLIDQVKSFGYAKVDIINIEEQELLLGMIENMHSANLKSLGEKSKSIFESLNPEIHKILGQKKYRLFSRDDIATIKNTQFFKLLKEKLSKRRISRIAVNGKFSDNVEDEEVYFRMVRPFFLNDVGVPHADSWYHIIYGEESKIFSESFKIWIPIFPESGTAGLSIAKKPNISIGKYKTFKKNGIDTPTIADENLHQIKLQPMTMKGGELLIFPPDTMHCGMVNYGDKNRVSIEITLL
jgi:hypothetical protein